MPASRISFIVIPSADGPVHEFRCARGLLWLGSLGALAVLGALVYFASGYLMRVDQYEQVAQLRTENRALVRGLQLAGREVATLEERLQELAADDNRLRAYHEMEPLTLDQRAGGIGGAGLGDLPEDYAAVPVRERALLDELRERLFRLQQETQIQAASFADIEQRYRQRQGDLRHFPTISPVPRDRTFVSSPFGYRTDPFTGQRSFHSGIDFAGRIGTEVWATADGVVTFAYHDLRLGQVVVIEHNIEERSEAGQAYTRQGLYRTEYGHLDRILVQPGQRVTRGQKIGEVGSTGRSTGPHLHYAVRYQDARRGRYKGYENPAEFILDEGPTDTRVANWVPVDE